MHAVPDIRPADLRANRLDLVSRLADDLAHEIKNPLNSMVVNLELVRRLTAAGRADAVGERVGILEEAVQRVHTLVDALLGSIRPPRPGDTADTAVVLFDVKPLLEARAHVARVELSFEGDEGGRVAMAAHELAQVLLNIVDNAMNVVGKGGRIRIVTATSPDAVSVVVADSGPGFDAAVLERIGAAGVTTWPGRAGLGLAVCHWLLERRHGHLEIEAEPDMGGAAVRFVIPRTDAA
ncbi:MAG: HAMP domain-containing sensor histidine kinase [Gemmatimonadota bacterium]|jgi:signal transduction histidine kinase